MSVSPTLSASYCIFLVCGVFQAASKLYSVCLLVVVVVVVVAEVAAAVATAAAVVVRRGASRGTMTGATTEATIEGTTGTMIVMKTESIDHTGRFCVVCLNH